MAPQASIVAPSPKRSSALRGRARRLSWLGLGTLAELLFSRRNRHSRYQAEEDARARRRRHRPHLEELEKRRSSGTVPAIGSVLAGPLGAVLAAEIMGPALLADTPATVAGNEPASGVILDPAPLSPLPWSEDSAAPPPTRATTPASAAGDDDPLGGYGTPPAPTSDGGLDSGLWSPWPARQPAGPDGADPSLPRSFAGVGGGSGGLRSSPDILPMANGADLPPIPPIPPAGPGSSSPRTPTSAMTPLATGPAGPNRSAGQGISAAATGHGEMSAGQAAGPLRPLPRALAPPSLRQGFGDVAPTFEANVGQTDPRVSYLVHGPNSNLFLEPNDAVLDIHRVDMAGPPQPAVHGRDIDGLVLDTHFLGANAQASLTGLDLQSNRSNYLTSADRNQWHTDIPNYAQVQDSNLYPGIDLLYHTATNNALEYDFLLSPGTDPSQIAFQVEGANATLDAQGDLVLTAPSNNGDRAANGDSPLDLRGQSPFAARSPLLPWSVVEPAPSASQMVAGRSVPVPVAFTLAPDGTVSFRLGRYDQNLPLDIDPVLRYSTYLGGTGGDQAYGIALDSSGDAYVTGSTEGANFPTTTGAYQRHTGTGEGTVFVTEFNPTGTSLVYSTFLNTSGSDFGNEIAVDSSGDAYVTGLVSNDMSFPTTSGAYQTTPPNPTDNAFVTEFNSTGSTLVYSTFLGGSNGISEGYSIAVGSGGDAYVTGDSQASNFPVTTGPSYAAAGGSEAFATEFNSSGSTLVYSTWLGVGSGSTSTGFGIALAGSDAAVAWTAQGTLGDYAQLTALSGTGSVVYADSLGDGSAYAVAADSSGNAYAAGASAGGLNTTTGSFQPSYEGSGSNEAFAVKVSPQGTLVWGTYLGSTYETDAYGVAVDSAGSPYLVGTTAGGFPTTLAFQPSPAGNFDGFITKFSPSGATLAYSSYLGGGLNDSAQAVTLDSDKHAFLDGYTYSTDFPTTTTAYDPTDPELNGNSAAFVAEVWNWSVTQQLRTDDPFQSPPDYVPWGPDFSGSPQTGDLQLVQPLDFLQHCPDS